MELEKRKRDSNREISNLKKALNDAKSIQERRNLMEKILEYKVSLSQEL